MNHAHHLSSLLNSNLTDVNNKISAIAIPAATSVSSTKLTEYAAQSDEIVYVTAFNESSVAENVYILINGTIRFAQYCPIEYSAYTIPTRLGVGDIVTVSHGSSEGKASMYIIK